MFGYNYKKQAIADKKIEEISRKYQLNLPDGTSLNDLIAGRNGTISKLQILKSAPKHKTKSWITVKNLGWI